MSILLSRLLSELNYEMSDTWLSDLVRLLLNYVCSLRIIPEIGEVGTPSPLMHGICIDTA